MLFLKSFFRSSYLATKGAQVPDTDHVVEAGDGHDKDAHHKIHNGQRDQEDVAGCLQRLVIEDSDDDERVGGHRKEDDGHDQQQEEGAGLGAHGLGAEAEGRGLSGGHHGQTTGREVGHHAHAGSLEQQVIGER